MSILHHKAPFTDNFFWENINYLNVLMMQLLNFFCVLGTEKPRGWGVKPSGFFVKKLPPIFEKKIKPQRRKGRKEK